MRPTRFTGASPIVSSLRVEASADKPQSRFYLALFTFREPDIVCVRFPSVPVTSRLEEPTGAEAGTATVKMEAVVAGLEEKLAVDPAGDPLGVTPEKWT